jgi:enoyl-CoA hydratase/carnithine racemase
MGRPRLRYTPCFGRRRVLTRKPTRIDPRCGRHAEAAENRRPGRALDLLLTGDRIDAGEAYRIGLVSRVMDDRGLARAAEQLAKRIAARPPNATAFVKEAARSRTDLDLRASGWKRTSLLLLGTEDRIEAANAFHDPLVPGR